MLTEPDNMSQETLHPELAAISAEAAALETSAPVAGVASAEPAPQIDEAQEWRDAAQFGRDVLCSVRDQYNEALTVEQFNKLGDALHKGAQRWGWTVAGLFGHPVLAIALAAFPIGKTMARVERQIAEEKAAKLKAQMQGQAAGQRTA